MRFRNLNTRLMFAGHKHDMYIWVQGEAGTSGDDGKPGAKGSTVR